MSKVRRSLRVLREKGDVRGLLGVLEMCVRDNFGGVDSSRYFTFITSEAGNALSHILTGCTVRYAEPRGGYQDGN